eukprot:3987712-Prymnesium_polylepis.1
MSGGIFACAAGRWCREGLFGAGRGAGRGIATGRRHMRRRELACPRSCACNPSAPSARPPPECELRARARHGGTRSIRQSNGDSPRK